MTSVTVAAPEGAHFEYEMVKTDRGTKELGEKPLLVWDDVDAAVAFYGAEGITNILDGTSLRVSFQSIARRLAIKGESDDAIADAQVKFRPGKRPGVGAPTPVSRARKASEGAAVALGDKADLLTELMGKIARGEIGAAELELLNQ